MSSKTARMHLLKQPLMAIHRQYKRTETRKHQLQYIIWESTLRCNLNCRHCGSDCKKDASVPDMPVRDFISAIDTVVPQLEPEKTTIVISGGEPLMRTDIEHAGSELIKRRFPWGLVSNGCLLSANRLKSLIDAGLHTITISLDGFEQSHNWLRGSNTAFQQAVSAIARVAASGLPFDVVSCVNQNNYKELDRFRELLIDLGVQQWRIFTIFPIGRAAQNPGLKLTSEQFSGLFEKIKAWRMQGQIHVNYGCEGFLGTLEGHVRDNFFFCRAGINIASILADGSVSGCNNINHKYIQGNIYEHSFAEIWDKRFGPMRKRNWMKNGKCQNCAHFKNCLGNGFHLRGPDGNLLFCHLDYML